MYDQFSENRDLLQTYTRTLEYRRGGKKMEEWKKKEEKNEKKNKGNSKFFVWIRRTAYGGDVDGVSFAGADRNAIKDKIGSKTDPLLLDLS